CSFASSSTLAKQIEQGAPADLFLSADQRWMDHLAGKLAIDVASRIDLLANALVIITPVDRPLALTVAKEFAFAATFSGRIAVGDPTHVPVGIYTREAFAALGWWDALSGRLAPAADARAVLKLVELGEVDAGVVYATDAKVSAAIAVAATIPSDLHSPIRYPIALTTTATPAAAAFLLHLRGDAARAVFAAAGFTAPTSIVAGTGGHGHGPLIGWLGAEEVEVLLLSLRVALASIALLALPGIALGWLLARRSFVGKSVVDALVHLPLVLPPVVTGYLLLVMFGRRGWVGVRLEAWFGLDIAFTWKGAALAAAVMAFPLMVRAVRLAIELTDREIEDAARTLGAGPLRVFLTVTLPLAAPGVLAGLVLAFARSLGEFGATITLAGNIAGESRTLPVAIYAYAQQHDGDVPLQRLVLISVLVSVLALIGSEWLSRRLARRLAA
ncbi:MAG: molybdate ABC transporter permease subunit, partial [Planctomycetes bacterium]|nr:molybdate ABC transporter permease subunit [Planctomycetota bacterium]